jgi:molybdate transport system permease protein
LLTDPSVRRALLLSLFCASVSTVLSLAFGVPLAWVLARASFPGRRLLRALVLLPLVLPPVVGGVGLLYALGRVGLLGHALGSVGVSLAFTTAGVVLAETFVAMPFLVVTVEGALAASDRRYEEVAESLGASGWTTFRRITLPLIGPSVAAGAVLSFARAMGEFGATITFAGNYPGTTQTMPSKIYTALQSDPQVARTLSMILLVFSIGVLALLRNRWLTRP